MDFTTYLKTGKVKKKTIDPEEGQALLYQAIDRLDFVKEKDITNKSAKFVFEGAYESVRESAQSLMSKQGYKPYSHEATISFIVEFYKKYFSEEDIANFDHFRILRNDSVYRAVQVLPEDAKDCLIFATKFVKKVKEIFLV